MNTERYLFRGKRANGKWVRGYYVPVCQSIIRSDLRPDYYNDVNFIASEKEDNGETISFPTYIDMSTLGQCTGLRDKNGKLIYEGDIVQIVNPHGADETAEIKWGNRNGMWVADGDDCMEISEISDSCFVIGNIHDEGSELER
jgi:uncharacterized phage protein (TIGR01671 family)